ncbi:MAG: CDP-alcohol phosphatidyltransferase family protein [Gammaproteobacteria bacterium]|nr:CDP-alcohol phosphatidyltransferase family protein [Gammaproteobacteria bacterium]
MASRNHIYTPANGLSAARLLSALPCFHAVATSNWGIAAAAFVFAIVTDMIDGPLARRRGEASRTGGLIDHSADALFCIAVLSALAMAGLYPVVLPFMIAAAFVQYVADSRVFAGKELSASRIGRYNGIAYFVLAGAPMMRNLMGWTWPSGALLHGIGWALVVTTAISMIDRLRARMARS